MRMTHAVWKRMGIRMTHVMWNHMGMRMAHAVWKHIGMRTTHAVWGAGMRMNYMGMRMSGAAISAVNGRRGCAVCGMRGVRVLAGGVAVGRIVAMVHCRNGVLTKCRIALPCCCNDALPHRGVVAALVGVSVH